MSFPNNQEIANSLLCKSITDKRNIEKKPEGLMLVSRDGILLEVNPEFLAIIEAKSVEEVLGKPVINLIYSEDCVAFEKLHQSVCQGKTEKLQFRVLGLCGGLRWLEINSVAWRNFYGDIMGVMNITRDITESKLIRQAQQNLISLIQSSYDFISLATLEGKVTFVNKAGQNLLGIDGDEEVKKTLIFDYLMPEDLVDYQKRIWPKIVQNGSWQGEYRFRHFKTNTPIAIYQNSFAIEDPDTNKPVAIATVSRDITDRKRAEQKRQESERRYQILEKVSPVGIFYTDAEGHCLHVNEQWCEITGLTLAEALGEGWTKAIHPEDRQRVLNQWYREAKENLCFKSEYRFARPDGIVTWVLGQAIAETNPNGKVTGYVATIADISDRKQAEEQLRYYAFYDALTKLPNRALFLERLGNLIARSHKGSRETFSPVSDGKFAVLFLNLNRFQIVKYSLGHLLADRLLIATARRLEECLSNFGCLLVNNLELEKADFPSKSAMENTELRELKEIDRLSHNSKSTFPYNCQEKSQNLNFFVAQVGLDEFAIILTPVEQQEEVTEIANSIYDALQLPFLLDGREVYISASIGIALSSIGYRRPEDFLQAADTAMHACKRVKQACYAIFEPGWHTGAVAQLQMETDLRRAIERRELQVYYQPIVALKSSRISGFEALVRWQHPKRGIISPSEFIPLAEETGLIAAIDRYVLREACRQISVWQQAFPTEVPLTLSVNLSGFQLSQLDLIEQIDRILRETGIYPGSLKLEITESKLAGNMVSEKRMLQQLKDLGIQLSIDDFGTGYSCLARLHQLPIDTLKIDRSFISSLGVDSDSLEIVRTIVTLAHSLGMDAIAEGVETVEQLAQLQALQCEYGQGYFFSKPIASATAWGLLNHFR
ncbi:sensor domain-containing protein [Aerosakkonema funiforme]|uniref:EAL domain-containing protein n=2 Tax=Oscillatoriophycideae TaxID=1301283 RepID=A0A926VJN5_9CYAN|nr:bifunctional diguanylate cyclase/phosphodiesterase [Aerosakkonema funiforme]MBD2183987.1 EAL domain-containing protein [Aerosakkonema funiforme FACHB-1375]